MNLTKLKLTLEVIFNPDLWHRNHPTNKIFDKWLWDKLEKGFKLDSIAKDFYTVYFQGVEIWISNAPYSDVQFYKMFPGLGIAASRITALRFRKLYKKHLEQQLSETLKKELLKFKVILKI